MNAQITPWHRDHTIKLSARQTERTPVLLTTLAILLLTVLSQLAG